MPNGVSLEANKGATQSQTEGSNPGYSIEKARARASRIPCF